MKKLFLTSVVLCILGWLCFQISVAIVGKKQYYSYSEITQSTSNNNRTIFMAESSESKSWTIVNDFPNIKINSAGINTIVTRGESKNITVRLHDPERKKVHVEATYIGGELTIEARSANITFESGSWMGLVNWLDDIFSAGNSNMANTTVIIEFPESKYESLNIQHGSGSMKVHDLYADYNKIHIGSGSFEFVRHSEGFTAKTFELELGSGRAVISGAQTEAYNIDIGSGSFDISGLMGHGHIYMGSGSGSVAYKEYNNSGYLDMGSGSLKMFVPENSSIELNADIGSGKVDIDACGVKDTITSKNDDNPFIIGGGENNLLINMGSGSVAIRDLSQYTAPVIEAIVIGSDVNITSGYSESIFSENSSIRSTSTFNGDSFSSSSIIDSISEAEYSTVVTPAKDEPSDPVDVIGEPVETEIL